MFINQNRIVEASKKVKGAEKASFGGPNLLYLVPRKVAECRKYSMLRLCFSMLLVLSLVTIGLNSALAADQYRNFEELQANEDPVNYNIFTKELETPVLIFAPHGGGIEGGTSELARELSNSYSTYLFEGLKKTGNTSLHITSTNFDEPQALELLSRHDFTLSLHGYASDEKHILVGGTDRENTGKLTEALNDAGFSAELLPVGAPLSGTDPANVANKNRTGLSIQLEISTGQRRAMFDKFSLIGREGSKNETFYRFTDLLSDFVNENVSRKAGA
ncbi:poly-gamma-glutamate hydrolase family protein [Bacillus spizizenii]|nr:poly-gamma-glutamate hydrolase family protein [Bacillus spizizenii]MCY8902917.1 poly-gamma-glutamate hydrolase family protein [Bacillus spizizenii]MCY8907058.1 poly-gamma-glutamate hydrolase family protein [Bacillus spizizenii]